MTVKELIEALNNFNEDLAIEIEFHLYVDPARSVIRSIRLNAKDNSLILSDI